MAVLLLVLFIGLPLLEIAVFIQVGEQIGVLPTILITVLTALAGTILLRAQGFATLARARAQMDQGIMPAEELFNGVCLLLAAFLLLVPGFVTDVLGLLLFVPAVRHGLRRFLASRVDQDSKQRVFVDGEEVHINRGWPPGKEPKKGRGKVIDGEFEDVTGNDPSNSGSDRDKSPPRIP
ncbi:MAG: FxsA family protein [Pseudomonadota bacterium]